MIEKIKSIMEFAKKILRFMQMSVATATYVIFWRYFITKIKGRRLTPLKVRPLEL